MTCRRDAAGSARQSLAATPVPSPCITVCRMDARTGWCEGCLRTIDEIAAWSAMDDDEQARRLASASSARRVEQLEAERAAMKQLTFYLDFISPFAYLAFEQLPQALEGCRYEVSYRPVLFAGAAQALGPEGPGRDRAEARLDLSPRALAGARARHPDRRCRRTHPFNPLPLLRLALACAPDGGTPNRYVCETMLRHVWRGGARRRRRRRAWRRWRSALAPRARPGERRGQGRSCKTPHRRGDRARRVRRADASRSTAACSGASTRCRCCAACLRGDAWFDGPAWDRGRAARRPAALTPTRAERVDRAISASRNAALRVSP